MIDVDHDPARNDSVASVPGGERHAATRAGGRAVARHVVAPVRPQPLGGAGDGDPVADLRIAGIQLGHRDRSQSIEIARSDGRENAGVQFLVDGEMTEPAGCDDADARVRVPAREKE